MRTPWIAIVALCLGGGGAYADAGEKPSLELGEATVTGSYDAAALAKVVARSSKKLLACYTKALADEPDLTGVATATFTIGANGKVTAAAATGLGDAVHACIVATISKLRFGKPAGGAPVDVSYPLTYDPGEPVEMAGGFGFGRSGFGPGGGGTGAGTIGTGKYQSGGDGVGVGDGRGGMRGRSSELPTLSLGKPVIVGPYDKAVLTRYIKRNIMKLQYCYEKQLLATPGLAGTVSTEFTIGADGKVTASAAAGVHDEVAACMKTVIAAIEFPWPKNPDGTTGEVTVKYPVKLKVVRDSTAPK